MIIVMLVLVVLDCEVIIINDTIYLNHLYLHYHYNHFFFIELKDDYFNIHWQTYTYCSQHGQATTLEDNFTRNSFRLTQSGTSVMHQYHAQWCVRDIMFFYPSKTSCFFMQCRMLTNQFAVLRSLNQTKTFQNSFVAMCLAPLYALGKPCLYHPLHFQIYGR